MNPEIIQRAVAEYLHNHPEVMSQAQTPAPTQSSRVRPPNPLSGIPASANIPYYQGRGSQQAQQAPEPEEWPTDNTSSLESDGEMVLSPMDPDLAEALRDSLSDGSLRLLSPENVFLQQVIRIVQGIQEQLNSVVKLQEVIIRQLNQPPKDVEQSTRTEPKATRLVFGAPSPLADNPVEPALTEEDDDEETETQERPQKKRVKRKAKRVHKKSR